MNSCVLAAGPSVWHSGLDMMRDGVYELYFVKVKEGVFAPGGHFWLTHVKDRFYFIVMAWRPEIHICDACLVYYSYR